MEYEIEESINPHSWQQELAEARGEQSPLLRWTPVQEKRATLIPESDEA
ncbi:hypothetical protein OLX02_11215 [Novosphingobium sp. KCTC 2891]|nr:hypothetical protein [Novosphingobium sp. KCTC 2891]MCW1383390.1 hypothetical protein [Novosphingobium sp. KCTC 2891]